MTRVLVHVLVVAALLSVAKSGVAQAPGEAVTVVDPIDIPPEHDPLAHAWDLPDQRGGFYLRLSTSIGAQNTRVGEPAWGSDALGGRTTNGFASGYGLDLGGFVRPWLALHLDTTLGVLWSGTNSDVRNVLDEPGNTRVLAYGFAPALTFFTPHRFFFKPAFGVGLATYKSDGRSTTTNPGFYMHLVAGKDLYTDRNFSFGLQFEVAYMLLGGEHAAEDARVRQFLFGVSFGFDSI